MKEILIMGAGDFGREVAWLIEDINRIEPTYFIRGFLDDDEKKHDQIINGYRCLGSISKLAEINKEHSVYAVTAVQDGGLRRKFIDISSGFERWATLIHPSVHISDTSVMGKGCIICANSSISVNTRIGDHCIINLSTTIGHDCDIGNYASIMSGVVVSGHVTMKEEAYLGSNSTIVPGRKIGERAKVGAGSVVIRNVKDGNTVMGVPAKILRV